MPASSEDYDVFLSFNSKDGETVKDIALRLEGEGMRPFLPEWHLIPGRPFQEGLEKALSTSATVAVFFGPEHLGPWHREEMRVALMHAVEQGTPIIPVLLPGAHAEDLPSFVRLRTWVDLSADPSDLSRLVAGIQGRAPGSGSANEWRQLLSERPSGAGGGLLGRLQGAASALFLGAAVLTCTVALILGIVRVLTPKPGPYVLIEGGAVELDGKTVVTRPFFMKRTEVTQAEWARVMNSQPAFFTACGQPGQPEGSCPVERVSWCDAVAYANRRSEEDQLTPCYRWISGPNLEDVGCPVRGRSCQGPPCEVAFEGFGCTGYRLPAVAEWRLAMEGLPDVEGLTADAAFTNLEPWAWYGGTSAVSYPSPMDCSDIEGKQVSGIDRCGPHPVGTKAALPNGLVDGLGNVWEWTHEPGDVGGGWESEAKDTRPGARYELFPTGRAFDLGFRLVRTAGTDG